MNMNMNIKTTLISAGLSIVGLLGVATGYAQPAHALSCNTTSNGLTYCIQNTGYNRYSVTLQMGHESETLDIQCYGKRVDTWRSYGHLSQSEAETFVRGFCAL